MPLILAFLFLSNNVSVLWKQLGPGCANQQHLKTKQGIHLEVVVVTVQQCIVTEHFDWSQIS